MGWAYYVLTALSLSIGWGIRGNFGHEFGAMLPGALAALAIVLTSGRDDWQRRAAYFAMFGALGWSFGGSQSYMQVIGYTHSGHSPSVLYGFAGLFVIGFLWAAPGGAGTALPACLDRERLTSTFTPMTVVFLTWTVEGIWIEPWLRAQGWSLNWYDTDWLGTLFAVAAVGVLCLIRRRVDFGSSMILHMGIGWYAAFLLLVNVLGLRMTPPRGDNWSGCLGMTLGLLVFLVRNDLIPVARATLVTGFIGGASFAGASMLKLVEVTSGLETNWHSVLEQTTGLFNGLAVAVAMAPLAKTAPAPVDEPRTRRWTEVYAVTFTLILLTFVNLRKNPPEWVKVKAVPAEMVGLSASTWFSLIYLVLTIMLVVALVRHLRKPLLLLPASAAGKALWLYLVLMWWMVVGNFERALVGFAAQRLITEGVMTVNAAFCTLLAVLSTTVDRPAPVGSEPSRGSLRRTALVGLAGAALAVLIDWGVVRAIYGDRFAGHASLHIRFGPNATINKPDSPK